GMHFQTRKNVLNYDDVMNTQREIIYGQRAEVLDGKDLHSYILDMIRELIRSSVQQYLPDEADKGSWNLVGLREYFMNWITVPEDFDWDDEKINQTEREDIVKMLTDRIVKLYQMREDTIGSEQLRELERVVLLRVVDTKWMAHIDDMDELKRGMGLRGYAQKNPVVEYRYEGFEMFDAMVESIREETVRTLLTIRLKDNRPPEREQVAKPDAPNAGAGDGSFRAQANAKKKPKPNDPCPCGSGKKYKFCCGMNQGA
ncbi:MAG: SEC-C domain-containing protein, partial [Oscillospiraceae bacterium]|nr:SEC-C domain-containing protein [Oscillospiraceae bacterium]